MGPFAVGDVVSLAFPYADFSKFKMRPALIVGKAEFNNLVTCQITSEAATSKKAISLTDSEFGVGGLKVNSYIHPDKLFTVEQSVIKDKVGVLKSNKIEQVKASIREIFS